MAVQVGSSASFGRQHIPLRRPVTAHELRWLNAMRAQCLAPAFLTPHARASARDTR